MQKVGTKEVKRMTLGSKDGNQPGRIINKGRKKKKKTKNEKKLRKHMTKNKRSDGDMKEDVRRNWRRIENQERDREQEGGTSWQEKLKRGKKYGQYRR